MLNSDVSNLDKLNILFTPKKESHLNLNRVRCDSFTFHC